GALGMLGLFRIALRVALRLQPVDAAGSRQPLVDLGLALEALDVADFGSGVMRLDLPVAFLDPLHPEGHARGFCHARNMRRNDPDGQGPSRAAQSRVTPIIRPRA